MKLANQVIGSVKKPVLKELEKELAKEITNEIRNSGKDILGYVNAAQISWDAITADPFDFEELDEEYLDVLSDEELEALEEGLESAIKFDL